jgi:hypothetical protein
LTRQIIRVENKYKISKPCYSTNQVLSLSLSIFYCQLNHLSCKSMIFVIFSFHGGCVLLCTTIIPRVSNIMTKWAKRWEYFNLKSTWKVYLSCSIQLEGVHARILTNQDILRLWHNSNCIMNLLPQILNKKTMNSNLTLNNRVFNRTWIEIWFQENK